MKSLDFLVAVSRDEEDPGFWNARLHVPDQKFLLVTCGSSLEETLVKAVDLVDIWVMHCVETNRDFGKDIEGNYRVEPSLRVQAAWMVRQLRLEAALTQADAAKLLGVSQQAYAKLEDLQRSNATMRTLDRLARAFHKPIRVVA